MRRARGSAKLIAGKAKAQREGWSKWIRTGDGEEADERAILNGCWFDTRRAEHWLEFAERYGTLTEGAYKGKKFDLLEWQSTHTGRLFGWVKHSNEWGFPVRRFKRFYLEIPKKNGKTPLISLIGNYLLFADSYDRQINLFTAATTRKQAEKVLVHAVRQVRNSDELSEVATVKKLEGFYTMACGDNEWFVLAADAASSDGVNGHLLADELHRWKGFEFYHAIKYMTASQPEGLFIGITTAGLNTECVCKTLHDHTIAVNSGRVEDEQFYGQIYGLKADDDPHDEDNWHKANPSLGSTAEMPLKLTTFRADYEAARDDATDWNDFLRLRLGVWQTSDNGWLDGACPRKSLDWDSGPTERKLAKKRIDCFEPFDDATLDELDVVRVTLGLDMASVRDTTAGVISIEDADGWVWIRPYFWLPESEAVRQNKRVPYRRWAELGLIKLTPGDVIDYRIVLADLVAACKRFGVSKFYYDPLFQAEWFTQELQAETGADRIEFPQTITHYAPIVKETERRIISHQLRHNGNQVLTWQIGNAVAYSNINGDKRIRKGKEHDYRKVDGVQAMIMSLTDVASGVRETSFYENNEVEVI